MDINQIELINIGKNLLQKFDIENAADCKSLILITYLNNYQLNGNNNELNDITNLLYQKASSQLFQQNCFCNDFSKNCSTPSSMPNNEIIDERFNFLSTFIPSILLQ